MAVDALTGVATRRTFHDELERHRRRLARSGGRALVLLVDLDGFKEINDRIGHAAGDAILALVVERLQDQIGEQGLLARVGGDEFAVLVYDAGPGQGWATALRRAVVAKPFAIGDRECVVEVSVGEARLDGKTSADSVLQAADEQMYLAKRRAGSDPFDRVTDLVLGILEAKEEGVEKAVASGVAEVAAAEAACVVHQAGVEWWPAPLDGAAGEVLLSISRAAADRDEVVEEPGAFAAPLVADGKAVGGFAVTRPLAFTKPDRIALARCGVAIGQALSRLRESRDVRARMRELEDLAFRDENTGLANRRALLVELERHQGKPGSLAVLFIDFDGLRAVNNELSYERGNDLLRAVAGCLSRELRPGEVAARLHGSGGDEFIVTCPGVDESEIALRAGRLEATLAAVPLPAELAARYRGASVGYALRRPNESAVVFLERAAALMRERKRLRKSGMLAQAS